MLATYALLFCRIAIILVFTLSFVGKVRDITAFREAVTDFRLLPESWSRTLAWTFPGAELAVVLLVMGGGSGLLLGFLLAAAWLMVFSLALVIVLGRNSRVTCNCFGGTVRRISPYDVARNTILLLCSLIGMRALIGSAQNSTGLENVLIGLMAGSFVVLLINLADIAETLRQPFRIFEA